MKKERVPNSLESQNFSGESLRPKMPAAPSSGLNQDYYNHQDISNGVGQIWNDANAISQSDSLTNSIENKCNLLLPAVNKIMTLDDLRFAISSLEKMLNSENSEMQLEATKKCRQLLSVGQDRDPIGSVQNMLDQTIVPQLLRFLKKKGHAALQVEALWALTNIAAGTPEQTHLLIRNDAVPTLVALLDNTHQEVLEQAVWVLGNIAGDGSAARDKVLAAGIMPPLLRCMQETKKVSLLRIATWTLSNLCDGQPRPAFSVDNVFNTIRTVLRSEDTEVLSHACWALSHLCDGPSVHINQVVNSNICPRLVELLYCKSWRVVKPALRTVGNIVCAEEEQDYTQTIIECKAVPCLRSLIQHSNREIQKEACWTLSNIAAGTTDQIQCVLDSGSIPTLVNLASESSKTDPDVRIEACWVLLNATSCGNDSQIQYLVRAGCIAVLCTLLEDSSMVMMALEGLEKILQVGEAQAGRAGNVHAALLDTIKIEALQKHRSSTIAKRAARMWSQHFVICAICETSYSRNSPATTFCAECNCHVCSDCNCSVYHLSYQDALWKDMAEGEAKVEKNKQQSKKTKRKKKKAKDKKRKELQKAKSGVLVSGAPISSSNSEKNYDEGRPKEDISDSGSDSEGDDDDEGNHERFYSNESRVVASTQQKTSSPPPCTEFSTSETSLSKVRTAINLDEKVERRRILAGEVDDNSEAVKDRKNRKKKDLAKGEEPLFDSSSSSSSKHPDLVETLLNNGSILDIWKMINDNDKDSDTFIPLETSLSRISR